MPFNAGDKFSFCRDIAESIEEILSWNADVVEEELCVVHAVQPHLVAHVLHSDVRHYLRNAWRASAFSRIPMADLFHPKAHKSLKRI